MHVFVLHIFQFHLIQYGGGLLCIAEWTIIVTTIEMRLFLFPPFMTFLSLSLFWMAHQTVLNDFYRTSLASWLRNAPPLRLHYRHEYVWLCMHCRRWLSSELFKFFSILLFCDEFPSLLPCSPSHHHHHWFSVTVNSSWINIFKTIRHISREITTTSIRCEREKKNQPLGHKGEL